jgi:hypothetical protein
MDPKIPNAKLAEAARRFLAESIDRKVDAIRSLHSTKNVAPRTRSSPRRCPTRIAKRFVRTSSVVRFRAKRATLRSRA